MADERVVVVTGLPGTGKSTIAERLSEAIRAPVFAGDWLLGALEPAHAALAQLGRPTFVQLYESLLESLITRQCLLQQSAIADCLVSDEVLGRWREIATKFGTDFYVVECVCSDSAVHRARVEGRVRNIPGWHEVGWDHVERMRQEMAPLAFPRLVLNALQPVEVNLLELRRYVEA